METREKEVGSWDGSGRGLRTSTQTQTMRIGCATCYGSKRHKAIDNIEMDEEKTSPPFIAVQLGKECWQTYAFIDSGGDGNTISYKLFRKLEDVKLLAPGAVLQDYMGHTTRSFGICKLELNVSELICGDKFFVTLPNMQDVSIILGRTWQRKYNCFLDWNYRLAHCQSADNQLWVPFYKNQMQTMLV